MHFCDFFVTGCSKSCRKGKPLTQFWNPSCVLVDKNNAIFSFVIERVGQAGRQCGIRAVIVRLSQVNR